MSDIRGPAGNFQVSIRKEPRYVDEDKCVGCGVCAEKCPAKVTDAFNEGLAKRKAIFLPYAQGVPRVYTIDKEHCIFFKKGKCRACEKFCDSKAINFDQQREEITVNVGAVILATGCDEFNVESKMLSTYGYTGLIARYGYTMYPNVLTNIQFERMLSSSGPFQGHLTRPSDGGYPHRIAWIQCVGSRDVTCNAGYCSSVCCMYAIKQAAIAKEHSSDPLDLAIFYMDMRTFGKDFDRYYERARQDQSIDFIRSKVFGIKEVEGTSGDLSLRYVTQNGELHNDIFDMVILSVGLQPSASAVTMAKQLNIDLNNYNFCATHSFTPVNTSQEGVFVCGAFQGPKDIPETVMQASGAAGSVQAYLASARGTLVSEKELPPERDVSAEPPRVGVFVCNCGINIGSVVNVPAVREYAATLPNVVFADENIYTCAQDSQVRIREKIKEHNLNRIVVAACSPRTHEPLFQETVQDAGLNKYLFEMANIRDQCSWVHMHEPEKATQKAKDAVRMAVAKANLITPLQRPTLGNTPAALIIGGGIAGMVSALNLADQGYELHLVEKGMKLGGLAQKIEQTLEGDDVQAYLNDLIQKASNHPNITVYTRATIENTGGYIGNFTTTIKMGPKKELKDIKHGVVIIATGAEELKTEEYFLKKNRRVIGLIDLEKEISKQTKRIKETKNAVIVLCVGSRTEERPYCSRVCCSEALKNALGLKQMNPEMNVYVLYRDVRSYGFKEDYYRMAREQGVIFINYEPDRKPQVEPVKEGANDFLRITVDDPIVGETLVIDADLLALALATVPSEGNKDLAQLFKVPLNADGYFLEAHMKLKPVEFATDGVFMCGLAHSPKFIEETIAQAQAAAARAAVVLSKPMISGEGVVSCVNEAACSGCKICVGMCAYKAIAFDEEQHVARINEVLCKGCGACAAACPSGACTVGGFTDDQLYAQIEAALAQ